jgi:acetyltransferase-like isoleucine patch superfamily enzyme
MRNKYTFSEILILVYSFFITKIFYKSARLIRRPFYIRGKTSLSTYTKLTTGYSCRFDLPGKNKKTLFIGKNCEIGDNVHIVSHENVTIGDNVLIASKVFISDTNHGNYSGENQSSPFEYPKNRVLTTKPVSIGSNVWIGENVCILPGSKIGNGSIIGSNSVVLSDIPEYCIAVGVPAKIKKIYSVSNKVWENNKNTYDNKIGD